jgi:hypothetical protein
MTWLEVAAVAVGGVALAAVVCWAAVAAALRIERRRRVTTR